LAEQLAGISGRFILTINAMPGARQIFDRFDVAEVETTWTISTATIGSDKRVTELIVRN
jgi:DNA adenine methylase